VCCSVLQCVVACRTLQYLIFCRRFENHFAYVHCIHKCIHTSTTLRLSLVILNTHDVHTHAHTHTYTCRCIGLGLEDGNIVLWDLLLLERQCKWKAHNAPISAIAFAHYSLRHGCNGKTHCNTLQHTATHCSTLQHSAALCSTLQHIAAHCNTLQHTTTAHCDA